MIHRITLSTIGLLTLITCSTQQNVDQATTAENSTKTTATTSNPKSTVPQMSTGMDPDVEALKQSKIEQAEMSEKAGLIYFAEGENKFLKEFEMNVTFKGISSDSRCPEGVNCVWEGAATAEVELMGLATRPTTVQLSTINDAAKGLSKTQHFNGYNFSLVDVTPSTTASKSHKDLKGQYKIGLKIEKGSYTTGGATTR